MKSLTLILLVVCFGMMVLSVYGKDLLDNADFDKLLKPRYQDSSYNFDNEQQPSKRIIRQVNRQPRPPAPEEDPFSGLESQGNIRPWPFGSNSPVVQPTNNQNPMQTSTTSSNSGDAYEELRNACNSSCREITTSEYNPVCGSDSQTYQNRRFLRCVAKCGIRTEFMYTGTCVKTQSTTPA